MDFEDMEHRLRKGEDPLELSIEKWQDVVNGTGECNGEINCALCAEFNRWDDERRNCKKCPVFKKTGKQYCDGSPYQKYTELEFEEGYEKELHELAKQELAFLTNLRPLWATIKVSLPRRNTKEIES